MTENHDRIERTLEVLLYAPLGFGLFLKDTAPTFVNMFVSRGRAEVDRRHEEVQRHVTTARSLGQVTMAFGPPLVRERVSRTVADARRRAEELLGAGATAPGATETAPNDAEPEAATDTAPTPTDTEPSAMRFASVTSAAPSTAEPTPPADRQVDLTATESPSAASLTADRANNGNPAPSAGLPIPGYDALSASQVVERLVGLAPEELDAVHRYEASHRQRRTILGKIEQLAG